MASEREAGLVGGADRKAVKTGGGFSRRETSEYISELVDELAAVARGVDLRDLAYLLDVAAYEAKAKAHELAEAPRKTMC